MLSGCFKINAIRLVIFMWCISKTEVGEQLAILPMRLWNAVIKSAQSDGKDTNTSWKIYNIG